MVNQIKGVLLEECVLFLLRNAGYRTILTSGNDPTLGMCGAGLLVRGRGTDHQIDAIADYVVQQPFAHPQRLLVEAKCFATSAVGLDVVRNAFGVHRDVSEYFRTPRRKAITGRTRYHYQYAVFATTAFTDQAQRFAFAQDIHLLPLARSAFFRPVVSVIPQVARDLDRLVRGTASRRARRDEPVTAKAIRALVRSRLQVQSPVPEISNPEISEALDPLENACRTVGFAFLAMAGGVFPLFLVPRRGIEVWDLEAYLWVRITYDKKRWYIRSADDQPLFSFDLPSELFEMYAEDFELNREQAYHLKDDFLSELQLTVTNRDAIRIITLKMDPEWFERVRASARLER